MLNLGIHRLAYLLFLMVVLNLFWTTNFPCKIFCTHPLGFVKIDFEPPDLSPLGTVLWEHPIRHSWKQEKKKTAWNLAFPSWHITQFYETEYSHCPPYHLYAFFSDVSEPLPTSPPGQGTKQPVVDVSRLQIERRNRRRSTKSIRRDGSERLNSNWCHQNDQTDWASNWSARYQPLNLTCLCLIVFYFGLGWAKCAMEDSKVSLTETQIVRILISGQQSCSRQKKID